MGLTFVARDAEKIRARSKRRAIRWRARADPCYGPAVPFSHILGQDEAIRTLTRAIQGGRVHHAYRFEGPEGVGKEMAAFALAQALVCTAGETLGCGRCDACRRAVTLAKDRPEVPLHPDVILIERGLYPPGTIGRNTEESAQVSVEQIRRLVLPHASYPPHEGRARVFIFRRAEELGIAAANALLKTLEEPRQGTHFVLMSSRSDRLLDTIRSRTLKIRFGPLPDPILRKILTEQNVPAEKQDIAVELAAGSAAAALELADAERTAARDEFVAAMLAAVKAPDMGPAVALAEARDTKDNANRVRPARGGDRCAKVHGGAARDRAHRAQCVGEPVARVARVGDARGDSGLSGRLHAIYPLELPGLVDGRPAREALHDDDPLRHAGSGFHPRSLSDVPPHARRGAGLPAPDDEDLDAHAPRSHRDAGQGRALHEPPCPADPRPARRPEGG
jgi:DNA polymerase-3 subunit delta'